MRAPSAAVARTRRKRAGAVTRRRPLPVSDGEPFKDAQAAVRGRAPEQRRSTSDADPCATLEVFVEHVTRLVLNAQALADRMEGMGNGAARSTGDRDARVQRLRDAVQRGQQAIGHAASTGEAPPTGR